MQEKNGKIRYSVNKNIKKRKKYKLFYEGALYK